MYHLSTCNLSTNVLSLVLETTVRKLSNKLLFLMSIGNHLHPVQVSFKTNEELLHLKQPLYAMNMLLKLENIHVPLHHLLKMVKTKIIINQTRYKGSLQLYLSMILLSV